MLEELTKKQLAKMTEYRDKWIKIGLDTSPANRKEAEKGIQLAYKIAKIKKPKIVWCNSPYAMAMTRAIIQNFNKISKDFKDNGVDTGASVWASVRDLVWASVGVSVRDSVGVSVRDSVWDSVRDSVWDSVWASVRASVWDSVRASVGDSVRNSVWDCCYGQHDANWLAFYAYFSEVCGLKKETKKLQGLWQIAKNANWFLPYEKICWVSERPCEIYRDERGRLHNLNSIALKYPDGWGVYSIHGVRVPEKYILTPADKIDPQEVLKESNAQIRMAVISKCGFAHFLEHLKYKTISKHDGNALLEFNIDNTTVRGLHIKWTTKEKEKHETVIPVPRTKEQFEKTGDVPKDINDCEQIRRWTMFADITKKIIAES